MFFVQMASYRSTFLRLKCSRNHVLFLAMTVDRPVKGSLQCFPSMLNAKCWKLKELKCKINLPDLYALNPLMYLLDSGVQPGHAVSAARHLQAHLRSWVALQATARSVIGQCNSKGRVSHFSHAYTGWWHVPRKCAFSYETSSSFSTCLLVLFQTVVLECRRRQENYLELHTGSSSTLVASAALGRQP